MSDDMLVEKEKGWKLNDENLNKVEADWITSGVKAVGLHAKTPNDLELNRREKGKGAKWQDYGSEDLLGKAKRWGAMGTVNKNLYTDESANEEVFARGDVLLDVVSNVTIDAGKSGEVVKIAFPMRAEGIQDVRSSTNDNGERYFPALFGLMVPDGRGEELRQAIEEGKVRPEALISHYYPGLKDRILIKDRGEVLIEDNELEVDEEALEDKAEDNSENDGANVDGSGDIPPEEPTNVETPEPEWGPFVCPNCGDENESGIVCESCGGLRPDYEMGVEWREAYQTIVTLPEGSFARKKWEQWFDEYLKEPSVPNDLKAAMANKIQNYDESRVVIPPNEGGGADKLGEIAEHLRVMREGAEKMDVKSGVEKLGLVDIEDWRAKYYEILHDAIDDIELGGGQVSLQEFMGRFNLVFEGTSQPQNFFQLMSARYGKEAKEFGELTVSMHKMVSNGIAGFANRKNATALLELRKGSRPNGYVWYDLDANDFDRIANMRDGDQLARALGIYVSLGKTALDNPDNKARWGLSIDGRSFVSPWVKKPTELEGVTTTEADLRRVVVNKTSEWAERTALAMMYATDLPGLFGSEFAGTADWASASRKFYYPIDELKRVGDIGDTPLPGRLKEDMFLVRIRSWGGENLTFLDPFADNKGGVIVRDNAGNEMRMNMLEAWSRGLFNRIEYRKSGFGATGKHNGGMIKAAGAYDAIKVSGEGKRLDRAGLNEFVGAIEPVLKGYGDWEAKYIQTMLQESWFWSFMSTVEAELIESGPGRSGKVDRQQFGSFIRKAHAMGFLLKNGEAKRFFPDLYEKIDETKEKIKTASGDEKDKLKQDLENLKFWEKTLNGINSFEAMKARFGPRGLAGFFDDLLGD